MQKRCWGLPAQSSRFSHKAPCAIRMPFASQSWRHKTSVHHKRSPDRTNRDLTSPCELPSSSVAVVRCLDCFLGEICNRSCSAISAKILGFVTQLDLLWELPINIPLEEAALQREAQDAQHLLAPQHHSQGRTTEVQRAQFHSAHTVNWVRFKEWGGYFWSRCWADSASPACMLKPDLWVCLCSSIFIRHDNNTEVNQGKFFKYILDSWYPWGNYFDLILLKVLPQLYCQSSFVAYKFIKKKMPVADFLIRT